MNLKEHLNDTIALLLHVKIHCHYFKSGDRSLPDYSFSEKEFFKLETVVERLRELEEHL